MKYLFITLLFLAPVFGFAQSEASSQNRSVEKQEFCLVKPDSYGLRFKAYVDDGKKKKYSDNQYGKFVKDIQGKDIVFDSIIAILNYMTDRGWVLVSTYGKSDEPVMVFKRPLYER